MESKVDLSKQLSLIREESRPEDSSAAEPADSGHNNSGRTTPATAESDTNVEHQFDQSSILAELTIVSEQNPPSPSPKLKSR